MKNFLTEDPPSDASKIDAPTDPTGLKARVVMQDDIFSLLMLILMLENGGGTGNINQLVLMFLLMHSKTAQNSSSPRCSDHCCRDDGYTF